MGFIYRLLNNKNSWKMSIKTGLVMTLLALLNTALYNYMREYVGYYSYLSYLLFMIICSLILFIGFRIMKGKEIRDNKVRMAKARAAKKAKKEAQEVPIS